MDIYICFTIRTEEDIQRPSRALAREEMRDLCPLIVRPMTDWREADLDGEFLDLTSREVRTYCEG